MTQNTEFILVHDKETAEYANLLQNNILKMNQAIPTRQTVNTVVWTEAQYRDNKPTLSSGAAIIFIGNNKCMKLERSGMEEVYEKFGMHILKAGDRYALFVEDETFPREKIDELNEYAKPYLNDAVTAKETSIEILKRQAGGIKNLFKKKKTDAATTGIAAVAGTATAIATGGATATFGHGVVAGTIATTALAPAAVIPAVVAGATVALTRDAMNNLKLDKTLYKFRYTLLMTVACIEQLPVLIGND